MKIGWVQTVIFACAWMEFAVTGECLYYHRISSVQYCSTANGYGETVRCSVNFPCRCLLSPLPIQLIQLFNILDHIFHILSAWANLHTTNMWNIFHLTEKRRCRTSSEHIEHGYSRNTVTVLETMWIDSDQMLSAVELISITLKKHLHKINRDTRDK